MTVRSHLDAALAFIEEECPAWSTELARALGGTTVGIELPTESFDVHGGGGRVVTSTRRSDEQVLAKASPAVLRELLRGELSLEDAVVEERILLYGPLEDLERMDDALVAFVNAAVRAPSLAGVLRGFLREGEVE